MTNDSSTPATTPVATLVFVHGFISDATCWDPFRTRIAADPDLASYRTLCFTYPTAFIEWNPLKQIPAIKQCGNALREFLRTRCPDGPLFLIGHSMGGLVIQSYLAQQIDAGLGPSLARIRSVILFATPNRGSTIVSNLRGIFNVFRKNAQEADLTVLSEDVADISDKVVESILQAERTEPGKCPIPFQIFFGLQDDIVKKVSAQGSFGDASGLPGDHSSILEPDPNDPDDQRYVSLKESILRPIGHPFIYEIETFDVILAITPASLSTAYTIRGLEDPTPIHTDNVALRRLDITFSPQNRCSTPYEQLYRSKAGWVECLDCTGTNEADKKTQGEYTSTGKRFSYRFTPRPGGTFSVKLRVFNGFAQGQRSWHNHMQANAHYHLFRFTLDLTGYHAAGYTLSPEPALFYHLEDCECGDLCSKRVFDLPFQPMPSPPGPWLRTWEVRNLSGGVVDIMWDIQPPPASV